MYTDKIREPARSGSYAPADPIPTLPAIARRRYTDEAFYRAEIKYVFKRTWLMAGHISELKEVGSYRLLDIPIAPIVAVRCEDNVVRAFLNSCRHRGAAVVRENAGCTKRFNCVYHGWSYSLDGKLMAVPEESTFPGLKREDNSLVPVRCEMWGGFIFINLDPDAQPLLEWLGPVVRRYSGPTSGPLRVVEKLSFEVNCNWKIAVEAFRESYHANTIHRRTAMPVILAYKPILELYDNGHGSLLSPYREEFLQQQAANKAGFAMHTALQAIQGLDRKEYSEAAVMAQMFPNYYLAFQTAGFPVLIKWPIAVDRCRLDLIWYGMDWGDGQRPAEWDSLLANFKVLLDEDFRNLDSIQASVEADVSAGFQFSSKELLLYHLHASLDKYIGLENIAPELRVPDMLAEHVISS
jgi:phenylpropionate dioxygenase-like ring-hydroxylating dioxygenase large terminal subunit